MLVFPPVLMCIPSCILIKLHAFDDSKNPALFQLENKDCACNLHIRLQAQSCIKSSYFANESDL